MRTLHVLSSIDPRGGGPIEAVRNIGVELLARGHYVEALTLDAPDEPFVAQFPLKVHAIGPSHGRYRYNSKLVPWLRKNGKSYDAIIVDGLWQYHSFATWRALRGMRTPYYVFTHGMLDPWFRRTYPLKHLKKWLYWPWAEYRVLRDARAVMFTCDEERLLARESFWLYRAREAVTSFGTREPPQDSARLREQFLSAHPMLRGKRILLFLSRIHPKKGCDLLIEAFSRVAGSNPSLQLVIAGPDQSGWASQLQARATALGVGGQIMWPGMLQGDMKWGAFYSAEAFMLPSHQENFGIVVAEALGCGLPVLISDQVNIWREVQVDQSGLIAPDTIEGTERLLRDWLNQSLNSKRQMAINAAGTFRRRFTVGAMADSLLRIISSDGAELAFEVERFD